MFSQRHYVFLANFIAYERAVSSGESWDKDQVCTKTIEGIARLLARRLADDNPKFDRERFLTLINCGTHGDCCARKAANLFDIMLVSAEIAVVVAASAVQPQRC